MLFSDRVMVPCCPMTLGSGNCGILYDRAGEDEEAVLYTPRWGIDTFELRLLCALA